MAKLTKSDKNLRVLELTGQESCKLGFGAMCDQCSEDLYVTGSEKVYYIPVLNQLMCKSCKDLYIQSHRLHPEDLKYETSNLESVLSRLDSI